MAVECSIDQVIYVSTFTGVKSEGVISPGSVGYDINCGVRLIQTKRINNIHFRKEHSNVITSTTNR